MDRSELSYPKKAIEEEVPAGPRVRIAELVVNSYQRQLAAAGRDAALKRIEILDPNKPFDAEALVPSWRHKIESAEFKDEQYKKALAGELKAL